MYREVVGKEKKLMDNGKERKKTEESVEYWVQTMMCILGNSGDF